MNNHVLNGHKFDLTKYPKEQEFEQFWKTIEAKFPSNKPAAKIAAKVAWKQAICEYATMKRFRLFWKNKDIGGNPITEDVEGIDIVDACRRAGIGGGAIQALDYYKPL